MTIEQVTAKVVGLHGELKTLVDQAMKSLEEEIIERNRERLLEGYSADDKFLQHGYKKTQEKKRQRKGLQVDHVDLSFEGEYQGKLRAEWDGEYVKIWSDDWKEGFDKYGGEPILQYHWGNILGLGEENMDWLADQLEEKLYQGLIRYFT